MAGLHGVLTAVDLSALEHGVVAIVRMLNPFFSLAYVNYLGK
jgi:hypothetical protein